MASRIRLSFFVFLLTLLSSNIAFSSTVSPSGGGGGASSTQGVGGGASNTPGSDSIVNVKNYGALGNGKIVYDAAQGNIQATGTGSGTVTAPAFTTTSNNDMMLTVYFTAGTFTVPTNPTSRINFSNGVEYNFYVGDQVLATAGNYATTGRTGSQTATTGWVGLTLPVKPASSSVAPTFVNSTNNNNGAGATSIACTVPTGLSNGQVMYAIIGVPQSNVVVSVSTPAGWTLYGQAENTANSTNPYALVYAKTVAGDSGSITWNLGASTGATCGILAYSGVDTTSFFDDPITSATASFTSADLNKLLCADGSGVVLASTTGVDACGTIAEQLNSTTIYPTFINSTGTTTASKELRYASDDTTKIQAAINALTSGGELWFPQGMYGQSAGLTIPVTTAITLSGPAIARTGVATSFHTNGVTSIACLTKSLSSTTPALLFTSPTGSPIAEAEDFVQNIEFIAGAGQNRDGCGGDGIDITNVSTISLLGGATIGFAGSGIQIKDQGGGSDFVGLITTDHWQSHYNGKYNYYVPPGSQSVQNLSVTNSSMSNANLDGLNISNSAFALSFRNNIFQTNNVSATAGGANVNLNPASVVGGLFGCIFDGNDIEGGNASTSGIRDNGGVAGAIDGCSITNNRIQGTGSGAIVLGNSSTNTYMNGTVSGNRLFSTGPFLIINGVSNTQISNNDCNGAPCVTSFAMTGGGIISSTGGAIPTVTCSGGSTGTSVTAGSTNQRGSFVSSSSASTNCTLTWSAASTWPQAPFCTFYDAGASITPTTYSMGACGTATCVVDFASATSKTIGYSCF